MDGPRTTRWELLLLHPEDDVVVALLDLGGGSVRIHGGGTLALPAPVPLGHKVARRAIRRGGTIRKYGAVIGEATADIAPGEHVHVHNLRSLRARREGKEPS